jgi:hypothetical protein
MAIDTADKRRNVLNIATSFLYLGLAPSSGIDTDDRENLSEVYIGFSYTPPGTATAKVSRIPVQVAIGL